MSKKDFTTTFLVNQTPEEVYAAVINVRGWWTGYYSEVFNGPTEHLNDEFTYHAGDGVHYSKQKLIEVVPNQRIVWLITESNLSFIEEKDEWTGTKVIFDISRKGDQTQLIFTHEGLTPEVECYDACAPTWAQYLEHKLVPMIKGNLQLK